MNKWKFNLLFASCMVVDYEGRSGGLALMWKRDLFIYLMFSYYHIDVLVKEEGNHMVEWHLTCIYGHSKTMKRSET